MLKESVKIAGTKKLTDEECEKVVEGLPYKYSLVLSEPNEAIADRELPYCPDFDEFNPFIRSHARLRSRRLILFSLED